MKFTVLIPAFSYAVKHVRPGLSLHLACQALALRRVAEPLGIRVVVASTPDEDSPGLWDRIRDAFDAEDIYLLDDGYTSLAQATSDLVKQHGRVVAHIQGTRQLRTLAGLRKEFPDRVRLVFTVHSFRNASWKRQPYSWILSHMLRRSVDHTVFLSPYAMNQFVNHKAVFNAGRGSIVPLGIEWDWEQGCEKPDLSFLDENVRGSIEDEAAFNFVYLAAFKPGKGHDWMFRSMAPVFRRHRNARLVLPGWGSDQIQTSLRTLASRLDIASQVLWPGRISRQDVVNLLRCCHAGIIPSRSETFGQCIVESMAAGLPVLGTRKGVGEWLIMDYSTGIGVGYGDQDALARAADYCLTHREAASAMGKRAAKLVRLAFDWDEIAASHLRIYQSLFQA